MMPDVGQIMAYEQGDLGVKETVEMFAGLVKSGLAWSLQGSYGRAAAAMIGAGIIDRKGEVTRYGRERLAVLAENGEAEDDEE